MSEEENATPGLPVEDFRARRDYLPDDAFALVTGLYSGPVDLIPKEQWHGLISLPTDVLLRTSDQRGTQLSQLHRLWELWVETLPLEVESAPFMFNAGWDAADDFNAATFTTAHGYYRQGMANLRSALDNLTIAAGFAVKKKTQGLQNWLSSQGEAPKFGEAVQKLEPVLGANLTAVLKGLYKELSGYTHSQSSATNAALWSGSNGPVWEPNSFTHVYGYFRDVMAMGFVLLVVGWSEFSIPDKLWPLFERPDGSWANFSLTDLKGQVAGLK